MAACSAIVQYWPDPCAPCARTNRSADVDWSTNVMSSRFLQVVTIFSLPCPPQCGAWKGLMPDQNPPINPIVMLNKYLNRMILLSPISRFFYGLVVFRNFLDTCVLAHRLSFFFYLSFITFAPPPSSFPSPIIVRQSTSKYVVSLLVSLTFFCPWFLTTACFTIPSVLFLDMLNHSPKIAWLSWSLWYAMGL